MTSKNYINDIQMFINEAYSDNEPLHDNQVRSKKVFNDYCNKIKQDLERLEELENDRLLDRAEKEELERVNKVLNHNLEEKVEIIVELKEEIDELSKDKTCFEKRCDKLENAIEILKGENGAKLIGIDNKYRIYLVDYELVKQFITREKYELLKEVFGE